MSAEKEGYTNINTYVRFLKIFERHITPWLMMFKSKLGNMCCNFSARLKYLMGTLVRESPNMTIVNVVLAYIGLLVAYTIRLDRRQ